MTPLEQILDSFRRAAQTEREKGTYFEELICTYLRHEASYADLFEKVWLYADWVKEEGAARFGLDGKDVGIDLVARTQGSKEYHAIQCKFYQADYRVRKEDIDSFFTASGQQPFSHRLIITTTTDWTENAEKALVAQTPPVVRLDLHDLETSQIDWARYQPNTTPVLKPKKSLRPHQKTALAKVKLGLANAERGKLIMACGTGKTFTSLKIAEELAGKNQRVLFLVPSLNLLSQTLTEWTQESAIPLHSFAVCSDAEVGKKRSKDEDVVQTLVHELRYPATTDSSRLAHEMLKRHDANHMSVVFSTYHSLEVISRAQKQHGLPDFDLVICDEAHRTTGATFAGEEESTFVKVHDVHYLRATKRLYMTATPRIYGNEAKVKAELGNAELCSMDDEEKFGKQLHLITFSEAVELNLLTDYKVLVLTISEDHVSSRLQELLKDENNQLKVDDAARIIGCWKALAKQGLAEDLAFDPQPMRRAVAFCQVIERQNNSKSHKVSSKQIAAMFQQVVDAYTLQEKSEVMLRCEAEHVDGTMNASEKESKLTWLKQEPAADTCRILSNVRCLSEGVDVPALDAILFLAPRNSPVDVVQSVGRVMRNAPGKKRGYVILPVVIPAGMEPEKALDDNKVYKVVWEVLQALRAHDDCFDAFVNKLDLIGHDHRKMEVIHITNEVSKKSERIKGDKKSPSGKGSHVIGDPATPTPTTPVQAKFHFEVGELERALYARIVKKCGNRNHWEDWANDIAKIANTHISRITQIISNPANEKEVSAFNAFAHELRDDLNDSISDAEVIEMLAQHLITKPVFDALFADYSFASHNPVSLAMQGVLNVLNEHHLDKEADTLERFYASVRRRAAGIDSAEAKQKIVVELYDKFFRNAFPRMTERLGIVYTPVEVVDFIIHSVNDLLQQEFGQSLGSKGVHIIDPFTGTGTFITRLLQSGLIKPEELQHKYQHEIHANEIVLLAYYIAAINIEAVYHSLLKDKGTQYQPFEGICLTDTFQMYEKDDLVSDLMEHNSARRKRQKKLDIRVIIGNPPYSAGQENANDNNQNISYPNLDARIRETYAAHTKSNNKNGLYDSYIRAVRWASDRIGNAGIIGFVSGSAWIERSFADGLRKCLVEEFSSLYVIHLRGDIRKNMLSKGAAKEGGNVFDSGSMTGIAVYFLIKNPSAKEHGKIFFHDIGDDLSGAVKREKLKDFSSAIALSKNHLWQHPIPDAHHDWINQRDDSFLEFIVIGDKKDQSKACVFSNYSNGTKTNSDSWMYNYSKTDLKKNMSSMVETFNSESTRYQSSEKNIPIETFVTNDPTKISWHSATLPKAARGALGTFDENLIDIAQYRPFTKTWLYNDEHFIQRVSQLPKIYPNNKSKNLVICLSGVGARAGFAALIVESLPNLHTIDSAQCFPLYLYEKTEAAREGELFAAQAAETGYSRRDAITDAGLQHFQAAFPAAGEGSSITKEDLFYYIYGLLHSPDYRSRYADNLGKELPRIPAFKTYADFRAYESAGRQLAHWHLNYESVAPAPEIRIEINPRSASLPAKELYYVRKMKFGKNGKDKDKSVIHYNDHITLRNIPLEAYEYIVNGKAALEWVMERQSVTTDKASGITNDANLYATETMGNPKYPLELLQRVCTVSLETNKIITSLPKLEI